MDGVQRSVHRWYALTVTTAAVAGLIGAAVLFWSAARSTSHPDPDLLQFENQVSGLNAVPPIDYLAVLRVNQVDPTKRQAGLTLLLFLPTLHAVSIVDESDGGKVFSSVVPPGGLPNLKPDAPAFVIKKPKWSNAQLGVTVTTTSQVWRGQVPLRLLGYLPRRIVGAGPVPKDEALQAAATCLPQAGQQLTLDLAGSPADYPSDQYVLTATVSISLPQGLALSLGQNTIQETFSPHTAAIASAGLPFTLRKTGTDMNGIVTVQLDRPSKTGFLVWLVALAPLLLLAAGLGALRRQPAGLGFATAAALVAILPLRQVLVPPDVGGFTRLDALLAGEVVAFVAVAALVHLHVMGPAAGHDGDGAVEAGQNQEGPEREITAAVITGVTSATTESLNRLTNEVGRALQGQEKEITAAVIAGVTSATADSINRLAKLETRLAYGFRTSLNQRRRTQITNTRSYRRRSQHHK